MLTSLIEFGANVEKIHKKTCLVLLEAEFYKLQLDRKVPKTTLDKESDVDFCKGVRKSKIMWE